MEPILLAIGVLAKRGTGNGEWGTEQGRGKRVNGFEARSKGGVVTRCARREAIGLAERASANLKGAARARAPFSAVGVPTNRGLTLAGAKGRKRQKGRGDSGSREEEGV